MELTLGCENELKHASTMVHNNKFKSILANLGTNRLNFSKNWLAVSHMGESGSNEYDNVKIYYRRYWKTMEPTPAMSSFEHY